MKYKDSEQEDTKPKDTKKVETMERLGFYRGARIVPKTKPIEEAKK